MSQVVKQFYSHIAAGDIPAVLECLAPEVHWELIGPQAIPYFGIYRGHEGV